MKIQVPPKIIKVWSLVADPIQKYGFHLYYKNELYCSFSSREYGNLLRSHDGVYKSLFTITLPDGTKEKGIIINKNQIGTRINVDELKDALIYDFTHPMHRYYKVPIVFIPYSHFKVVLGIEKVSDIHLELGDYMYDANIKFRYV